VPADPLALLEHCRRHLAKFKVPASVVFTDAIPRTASGKVIKTRLREEKL
jgi:fatty-acyl-CoA synthase